MHDFILSAMGREAGRGVHETYEPVPRPRNITFPTLRSTVFCPWCDEMAELVSASKAAEAFNTDLQDIQFLLDSGQIHSLKRDAAVVAICRTSLEACFEARRTRLLDSHFEIKMRQAMEDEAS